VPRVDVDSRTGFFSEVWRGSWQGIPVAIKQLDPTADKKVRYQFFNVTKPDDSSSSKRWMFGDDFEVPSFCPSTGHPVLQVRHLGC
jgi:hypothetical protein